jgi:hypothetical protein
MALTVVYKTDSNKIGERPLPVSFKNEWKPGTRIKSPDGKESCTILRIVDSNEKTTVVSAKQPVTQSKTMLKLSKYDVDKKETLVLQLKALESSIEKLVDEYNDTIGSINQFAEDIQQRQQDYYDDRSETWQESDRGSEYEDWKSEWECFEELETIECPEFVDVDDFKNLPDSMD